VLLWEGRRTHKEECSGRRLAKGRVRILPSSKGENAERGRAKEGKECEFAKEKDFLKL